MADDPNKTEPTDGGASDKAEAKQGAAGKAAKGAPAKTPAQWLPSKWDHDLELLKSRLVRPNGPCTHEEVQIVAWGPKQVEGFLDVPASKILSICELLRDDSECRYDLLMCMSGVDYSKDDERLAVIYHLLSVERNRRAQIRTWITKADPTIDTVESVWPAANWHERETYDLVGIQFNNHSDLRRILCPEDWVGFALRKDYEFPKEYHGISCV
ncbi:MAG: NADH-quinone oxidoreductase subunit C [Planctomycetota bacterium]